VPALSGVVTTQTDSAGIRTVQASYQLAEQYSGVRENLASLQGSCVMKHDYIGPFDTEFDVSDDYEDIVECQTDTVAHIISSTYASGDRVYVALDYDGALFHQPVRLHAQRVYVP